MRKLLVDKICRGCHEVKPLTDFYKRSKDSYRSRCKSCCNKAVKEYILKHPDQRKATVERYDKKNRKILSEKAVTRRMSNPEKSLLSSAKNRAQKYGIPIDITEEDIVIPANCPVFGFPLIMHSGRNGGRFNSPSLDRIVPEEGYVKGNVRVISYKANAMKSNASKEDLIKFAEWILKL